MTYTNMQIISNTIYQNEQLIDIPEDAIYADLTLYIDRAETHQSYKFVTLTDNFSVSFCNGAFQGVIYKTDDNKIKIEGNCMCNIIFFKSNSWYNIKK